MAASGCTWQPWKKASGQAMGLKHELHGSRPQRLSNIASHLNPKHSAPLTDRVKTAASLCVLCHVCEEKHSAENQQGAPTLSPIV
jgi:hypothetical protein